MAKYTVNRVVGVSQTTTTADVFSTSIDIADIKDFKLKDLTITVSAHGNYGTHAFVRSITIGKFFRLYSGYYNNPVYVSDIDVTGESKIDVLYGATGFASGSATIDTITATITYEAEASSTVTNPLTGTEIPKTLDTEFSWNNVCPAGEIASQTLNWKYQNESVYNKISLNKDDLSYVFPANTFSNGKIDWFIEFVDVAGNVAKSSVETVTVGITPTDLIPSYPVNSNIRISNKQIFTWELVEAISTGQKSYEIKYKKETDSDFVTISGISSEQFHIFPADTFEAGSYIWGVRVTNNDDVTTDWIYSSFNGIGSTEAPNITNITNSSIPTISWEIESQDTFELEIYSASDRLYSSGIQVGSDIRSFTANIMLDDGNYIVKMRAMNEYGYFTDWADYSFVLKAEKPAALTCYAFANDAHGVTIAQSLSFNNTLEPLISNAIVPSAIYVLRRRYGTLKWDIIGKLSTTDSTVKYNDNTAITGIKYEYALRNYKEDAGYIDSNIVSIIVEHVGCLIYSGNEFVELYKTEDQQIDIMHSPSKQYSYAFAIGRKYPIKESSEWISQNMSISCFVKFEQYEMLNKFYESNEFLWFKNDDFSYQCSIDSITITETLWGKGYTLNLTISRIDEEELKLF